MDCRVFIIIVAVGGAPIVVAFATTKFKTKKLCCVCLSIIHFRVSSFVFVVEKFVVFVSFSFSGNVIL